MLAFNSKHTSLNAISNAFFTVEGGGKAVDTVSEILSLCGNRFKIITPENKAKSMRRRVLRQILSYRFAIRQRSFYRSAVFQSRKARVHCQH